MNEPRIAPQSMESEQALLGGLFIDVKSYDKIAGLVTEQDFFTLDHRKIFRSISRLMETGQPVDVVTVAEFLQGHHQLDEIGGLPYLAQLAGNTPGAANIKKYAEIVREAALKRALVSASNDISEKVCAPSGLSGRELLDFAQAKVMSISEKALKHTGGPQHVGPVMDAVLRRMDELGHRKNHDDVTGLPTGFKELDKMTTGMQAGELIVIAARPAMGKTALALNIVEHVALEQGKAVAFFSLEMANDQLGVRLLSSAARMNQQRVKVGRLNEAEWGKVHTASNRLREAGIYLDEEGSLTANELRSRARTIHRECGGLGLVVVDYLQLMQGGGRTDNRAQEVAEISRALKLLAKELCCPVIALSQLNRGLEQRPNRRPIMSDLRDSGGIEQDADWILFIYRDEVYNPDSPDKGIAELIIGKQRNGPTGTVDVNWRGEWTRFEDRQKSEIKPSTMIRQEKASSRAGSRASRPISARNGYTDNGPDF
jgi:replicative DNA helicase